MWDNINMAPGALAGKGGHHDVIWGTVRPGLRDERRWYYCLRVLSSSIASDSDTLFALGRRVHNAFVHLLTKRSKLNLLRKGCSLNAKAWAVYIVSSTKSTKWYDEVSLPTSPPRFSCVSTSLLVPRTQRCSTLVVCTEPGSTETVINVFDSTGHVQYQCI